jgi:hypothetical protein
LFMGFSPVYSQWICGQCNLSSLLNVIMKMSGSQSGVRSVPSAKLQCKQRFVLIIWQTSVGVFLSDIDGCHLRPDYCYARLDARVMQFDECPHRYQ